MRYILIFVMLQMSASGYSQTGPLSLTTERDFQRNVVFYVQNSSDNDYHIVINVTKMTNLRADFALPFEKNIGQGRTKLFKLLKGTAIGNVDYDFTWSSYKGWANPKFKEKISYLMPVKSGKKVKVLGLSNLKETYGGNEDDAESEAFYALGFKMNHGDTVFAARRGEVISIKDGREPVGENLTYSKARNSMVIRHLDKTLMNYSVLKNGSFLVRTGDFVEAGDPLAIVGGENYAAGPHVRLNAYFLSFDKTQNRGNRYGWSYMKPVFATEDKGNIELSNGVEYTSLHTQSLILQEWTKRELKKKGKKKKK